MQVFQRITIFGQKIRNLCAFSSVYLHAEWDSALFGIWIWFSCFAFEKMGLQPECYNWEECLTYAQLKHI